MRNRVKPFIWKELNVIDYIDFRGGREKLDSDISGKAALN